MAKQTPKETTSRSASNATQAYLNIAEVKDGVVVLKDGTLRAVLMTSAVNFALKSGQEQDGMIYAYQSFLNSLTFPVQILIQSRKLDLDFYIEKLNKRAEEQPIELIKLQIMEYSNFINRLISVTNIMDKRFFVVVPFYPTGVPKSGSFAKFFATKPKAAEQKQAEEQFQSNKVQLMQRVESVASGLGGLGLRAVTLDSEELVELFYNIYNPSTSSKERFRNVDELTAPTIARAGSPEYGDIPDVASEPPPAPVVRTQDATEEQTPAPTAPSSEPATSAPAPASETPAPAAPDEPNATGFAGESPTPEATVDSGGAAPASPTSPSVPASNPGAAEPIAEPVHPESNTNTGVHNG